MLDEVHEPLGLWPNPRPRPTGRAGLTALALAAAVVVAVAMAAFTFGRYDARRHEELALAIHAPAPVRREPLPPPRSAERQPEPRAAEAGGPPIAAAGQIEPASDAKVIRNGAAAAPTPLIIDVQQALAAQRAKAGPADLR